MKVFYTYKSYQDAPKTTKVSKILNRPSISFLIGVLPSFVLIFSGGSIYRYGEFDGGPHIFSIIGSVLMVIGLLAFLFFGFAISFCFNHFWGKKMAYKERRIRKASSRDSESYDKALMKLEKDIEECKSEHGENHPDVASLYSQMGYLYFNECDYKPAISCNEKVLTIKRALNGDDHPDVATSYSNIGSILMHMDEYKKALVNYEKALEIRLKVFGEQHPAVAESYINVGTALFAKGTRRKTIVCYEKALEIFKAAYDLRRTAELYDRIADVYEAMWNQRKASEYHEKAAKLLNSLSSGEEQV